MPWFKKEDEVPEELKNLTPQQVLEKIKAGETAAAKVTELEGKQTAHGTELQTLRDQIKALETRAVAPPKKEGAGDPPKEPTSFLEDEDRAFDERFNSRIGPMAAVVLSSAELAARMSWRNEVIARGQGHVLAKLEAQVDELMQKELPVRRTDPKTWANMFTYVKGMQFDDTVTKMRKGEDVFSEPVSGGRSRDTNDHQDEVVLTDEDKALCKKFRLSEKEFLEQKKTQQVVA